MKFNKRLTGIIAGTAAGIEAASISAFLAGMALPLP